LPAFAQGPTSTSADAKVIFEKQALEGDSRKSKDLWNEFFLSDKGLFKPNHSYHISFDYKILARAHDGSFYSLVRSASHAQGDKGWQEWNSNKGSTGSVAMDVDVESSKDSYLIIGIKNQGEIRIDNLKIASIGADASSTSKATAKPKPKPKTATTDGTKPGWETVALDSNTEDSAPPALPKGAQSFVVDAPLNDKGPIFNLKDFGAIEGLNVAANGPHLNLAAFNAAIAKCRSLKAAKLEVPKGVYRVASDSPITFERLNDFVFDGGGSTFLFDEIGHGAGMSIKKCNRSVFCNFNLDWDWKKEPLASIGTITKQAPDRTYFEMRFETPVGLDPKRWETMTPLDEKLRVPGPGEELSGMNPTKIERIDTNTVRVFPHRQVPVPLGKLYIVRHYMYEKHGITMDSNTHLSLQQITIFSFPGLGFVVSGDQHHFELLNCRITFPPGERRAITTTADGVHVMQSQGYIKMEDCDFGYMGDDCVNMHDVDHMGVRRVDDHTLVASNIVTWECPFANGDPVEIRNPDYSPTGFTEKVKAATPDFKAKETTLVFEKELPKKIDPNSILFNHRYGSKNYTIRNCYFHENRARGVLIKGEGGLIEDNRFYHNQHAAMQLEADVSPQWDEGFGAQNVIVRGNKFEDTNSLGAANGTAVLISATVNGKPASYPILANILFENNEFKEFSGPAFVSTSFKNLVIRNNSLINRRKAQAPSNIRGWVTAEFGNGLRIEGNTWTSMKDADPPALTFDPRTTKNIDVIGNVLK
jgi:hypothetical protein